MSDLPPIKTATADLFLDCAPAMLALAVLESPLGAFDVLLATLIMGGLWTVRSGRIARGDRRQLSRLILLTGFVLTSVLGRMVFHHYGRTAAMVFIGAFAVGYIALGEWTKSPRRHRAES